MLQKKLTKVGNSYALILDKPLMDMAGLSVHDPVVVYSTGHGLVVAPAHEGARDFAAAKAHVFKHHDGLMKRLADK